MIYWSVLNAFSRRLNIEKFAKRTLLHHIRTKLTAVVNLVLYRSLSSGVLRCAGCFAAGVVASATAGEEADHAGDDARLPRPLRAARTGGVRNTDDRGSTSSSSQGVNARYRQLISRLRKFAAGVGILNVSGSHAARNS